MKVGELHISMRAHQFIIIANSRKMNYPILISLILVVSILTIVISIQNAKQIELSIGLFSFKFKYLGGVLVIISILLSLFELIEDDLQYKIRIFIANLGLIIIILSRDKLELKDSNSIKIVCFYLSMIVFYLVNHLMVIFFSIEETMEFSRFVLDLLVIYIISYHIIKYKLVKGV